MYSRLSSRCGELENEGERDLTSKTEYQAHAIGITRPLKLRAGDIEGVWLVRGMP
jgi:hypothetical protein